ncbi:MAG TPA: glycogen-binding domain-containing protein [Verrucomicrobiae bacterium]|jgi:hypothetical protein
MKTSLQNNFDLIHPALFRIAAFIENTPAPRVFEYECASVPTGAAFASLRSAAEKPKTAGNKNGRAARAPGGGVSKRQAARTVSSKNSVAPKNAELKKVEFHLEAPSAKSVKLAADFTDWEKFPIDMIKTESGVWFTDVPLSPGRYSYRFIVDGLWRDDPRPALRVSNPFGTANAVLNVT